MNIAYFTSIIFEDKTDIIIDNAKLQAEKFVTTIVSSLMKQSFKDKSEQSSIAKVDRIIKPLIDDYVFFSENGKTLQKSKQSVVMPKNYLQDGLKSRASQDFTGKRYYLKISDKNYRMYFYIPLHEYAQRNLILLISYDLLSKNNPLSNLYSQAMVILFITTLFHVFFAILMYRVIIKPINQLHDGITEISEGNLSTQVKINRQDEIGSVATAFNTMAQALKQNMDTVEEQLHTIQGMATTDELTGLYNRRFLFTRMDEEIKRTIRRDYDMSFIMIDIDHFKDFNDKYGHQIGDLVLKEVTKTIKFSCKDTDIVARYGGEEIAVVALDCSMQDLLDISERIRYNVEETKIKTTSGMLSVTVSLGCTCFNNTLRRTIGSTESLIFFADTALYRAKEKRQKQGRNWIILNQFQY